MVLQDLKTCGFKSELQGLIALCRRTRFYVDYICQVLLDQALIIMPHGYAVIDLGSLNASEREEICLSRFLALVLQFISQRDRPVRGSASRLVLGYVRTFPCKTSLTAAGCYLCPAPGTKGTKVLVCCSVHSAFPVKTELCSPYPGQGQKQSFSYGVEQIVKNQKCMLKHLVPDASHVHFLDAVSSKSVLVEARKLKILSESTYESILQLQMKEKQLFKSKSEVISNSEPKNEVELLPAKEPFRPGQSCYFMSRFFLTWMSNDEMDSCYSCLEDGERTRLQNCRLCMAGDLIAYIRHMIDEDWLVLAKLSNAQDSCNLQKQKFLTDNGMEQVTDKISLYSNYARSSAQQALRNLKSIPVAARRGLPVIVSAEGFLLSVPSIGFNHCPSLMISAQFKPRVPLGGGHSSFI